MTRRPLTEENERREGRAAADRLKGGCRIRTKLRGRRDYLVLTESVT